VRILSSGANGSFGSEIIRQVPNCGSISLRHGEIGNEELSELANCDVFIHCGALLHGNFSDMFGTNVLLTKEMLDYLSMANPSVYFIHFSSISILQKKCNILPYDYLNPSDMTDYQLL
jgi:thioester reductase-like protein